MIRGLARASLIAVIFLVNLLDAQAEPSLLVRAQIARKELSRRSEDSQVPLRERLAAKLRIGEFREGSRELAELRAQDPPAALALLYEHSLREYDFDRVAALTDSHGIWLRRQYPALWFRWLFVREDLHSVDKFSGEMLTGDSSHAVAEIARGELAFRLLNYDEAAIFFSRALKHGLNPAERAGAVLGLAKVLYKRNEYQQSLDTLATLFSAEFLTDEILFHAASALIYLSRVNDAMSLFEEILNWNPSSEMAHYYLGNGYARMNYTQLERQYGDRLADSLARRDVARALGAWNRGQLDSARALSADGARYHSGAALPQMVYGSVLWSEGKFDSAANYFRHALRLIPEYGRAHNGLAKSLEGLRMRWNVHRASDSKTFEETPTPDVPGIEQFISNWSSLSERHRKQVALAVAPWKRYLPVLIECGSHHYIKPLHEKLSECPNLQSVKDLRISYDSRLWDDVRGCGGFTTVTGIEDVERSIFFNYNTVLHELTHQVHGLFPPDDLELIRETWHHALAREKDTPTLMSRYQAASEWEYFAEGANAYFSPRRNEYDTREIVRERLRTMDTALVKLVEKYLPAPNLDACYPVGYVNAATDATEKNELSRALELLNRAYQRAPHSESVLAALSHTHSLLDHDSLAARFADSLLAWYPQKAQSYQQRAEACFFTHGNASESLEILNQAISKVDSSERKHVYRSLGDEFFYLGEYVQAARCYRRVLQEIPDDPEALWGLGNALRESHDYSGADSAYQKALARRSGLQSLRLDYAEMLLAAERLLDAEVQIQEAAILAPDDEQVWTAQGRLAAAKGDSKAALECYNRALNSAPYLRLPQILKYSALKATGQKRAAKKLAVELQNWAATDVPEWVYVPRISSFIAAKTWPQTLRQLLADVTRN